MKISNLNFVTAAIMALTVLTPCLGSAVQERGGGSAVQLEIQHVAELLPEFIKKYGIALPDGLSKSEYDRTVRRILGQEKPYINISVVRQASLDGQILTAVNDGPNSSLEVTAWEWYQIRDPKLKIAKVHHEIAGLSGKFDRVFYPSSRTLLNYLDQHPEALAEFYGPSNIVAKLAPRKIVSANDAPEGWRVLANDERYSFANPYTALDQCQKLSAPYQTEYKYVTCELLARSGKETYRWTEVHNEEVYEGKTTSTQDRSINIGIDLLFIASASGKANDKEVSEKAIVVNKPVKMEMFREYATMAYGYRILVRDELILNPDLMNRVLLDTANEEQGFFTDLKPARDFCRDSVLQMRNLIVEKEYEAAGHVYQHENGKYACRIEGRRKYMVTE